jgi:hypothetical protein
MAACLGAVELLLQQLANRFGLRLVVSLRLDDRQAELVPLGRVLRAADDHVPVRPLVGGDQGDLWAGLEGARIPERDDDGDESDEEENQSPGRARADGRGTDGGVGRHGVISRER